MGIVLTFSELPASCPPVPRDTSAIGPVFRVLDNGNTATAYDWLSHQARGEELKPGMDPCRFASLSLFKDPSVVKKYKNLKDKTHAAELHIPADIGAHTTKKNGHVDFWCADGNLVSGYVAQVVSI